MKRITAGNHKKYTLYVPVSKAVAQLIEAGEIVCPVNVLLRMGRLDQQKYDDWRFGRVPYLERVIAANLSMTSRILRILHCHAESLQLTPSATIYKKWGKGPKQTLRFSKSGHPQLERAYSQHYLTKKQKKKQPLDTQRSSHVRSEEAAAQAGATTSTQRSGISSPQETPDS